MPTPTIIPVMERFLLRLPLRMILAVAKPIQPPIAGTVGKKEITPEKKASNNARETEGQQLLAMPMM